jgi:hypothetical protein
MSDYMVICDCKGAANRRLVALIDDDRTTGTIVVSWGQALEPGGSFGGELTEPNKRGGRRHERFGCPDCQLTVSWAEPTLSDVVDILDANRNRWGMVESRYLVPLSVLCGVVSKVGDRRA